MNERIRELAKEALDYAEKNQSAEVQQHWFKLYTEKFAELLIRECADKAHEFIIEDGDDFPKTSVAYRIKQHFGVE